jgi:hypothetical protein
MYTGSPVDLFRWMSMGYPMKKEIRIKLIVLYYELTCE